MSFFENLHNDPRWLQFQKSIGVAPEQVHTIAFGRLLLLATSKFVLIL